MKIEIEYTKEELSELLNSLNNAIIALDNVFYAADFGTETGIPKKLLPLFDNKTFEEIDSLRENRMNSLIKLYKILLNYENKI